MDIGLIDRAIAGDKSAYSSIVDRYKSMVYAIAYERLGSFEDARDVAQDVFVAAYIHLPKLDDRAKFGPWLRRITSNACSAQIRGRQPTADIDRMQVQPDAVERLLTRLAVDQALGCLSPETRSTVVLYYFHAYSTAEIAEFQGITVDADKSRLQNNHARLKKEMIPMIEGALSTSMPDDFAARVTSIIDAAINGNDARVRELLTTDAALANVTGPVDVDAREHMAQHNAADGWTALHLASHYGHLPIVKLLVEHGADVEAVAQNAIGNTPISAAAWGNRLDIVAYLATAGANVDAPNAWGSTALHRAIEGGNWETAKL